MTKSNKREHKVIPSCTINQNRYLDSPENLHHSQSETKTKKGGSKANNFTLDILKIIQKDPELGVYSIIKKLPKRPLSPTVLKKWLRDYGLNTKDRRKAAVEKEEIDDLLSGKIDLHTFKSLEYRFSLESPKYKYDPKKFVPLILEIVSEDPEKGGHGISKELKTQGYTMPDKSIIQYLRKYHLSTKEEREKAVKSGKIKQLISKIKHAHHPKISCKIETKEGFTNNYTNDLMPFPKKLLDYKLPCSLQEEFLEFLKSKHPGENLLENYDINKALATLCDEYTVEYDVLGAS